MRSNMQGGVTRTAVAPRAATCSRERGRRTALLRALSAAAAHRHRGVLSALLHISESQSASHFAYEALKYQDTVHILKALNIKDTVH